jgi:hypothetical protein
MNSKSAVLLSFLMVSSALFVLVTPARADEKVGDVASAPTEDTSSVDGGAFFVSPITALRYEMVNDPSSGGTTYRLGTDVYGSVESILDREAALFPDGQYKIEPALRGADASGESDGRLPVIIFLAPQFGQEVSTRIRESRMAGLESLWGQRMELLDHIMSTNVLGPLPAEAASIDPRLDAQFRQIDSVYSSALVDVRGQIYGETEKLNLPTQDPVVAKIINLGGRVMYRGPFVNLITARISPEGLREIVKDPLVGSVYRDGIMTAQLDVSVPSIHASDWWTGGYNTNTYKFVVSDTGVNKTHPALVGVITDEAVFHDEGQLSPVYADNASNPDDLHGHGTHVAGIVGSQDTTYRGVAYGLKGIVNAKFGWLTSAGDGAGTWSDAIKALDWAFSTAGASIGSLSYGDSTPGNGNGGFSKFLDAIVDDLGVPYAVAAGNDGPGGGTLGQPGDAFNVLTVGAMDDQGSTSRTGDTIADFSSRGPTTDGRIKPDIVAPGEDTSNPNWGIYSCNAKWKTQSDWIDFPGTSMASPHIGASLVLLMNYLGPRGFALPAIPKALLLENAEDKGAIGPDNNYGWGYVDLAPAFTNRDKVYNETTKLGQPRFYLGTWTANDKATLVWQRHVTYKGAAYPTQFYALNNLDLFLYNAPANTFAVSSTSPIDNVEQTRYGTALASAVLKVKAMAALVGVTNEPFALATQRTFTYAKPPTYQIIWTGPSSIEAGNTFALTANVTNVGDLTGFGAVGTLNVPAGLTLLTGNNPVALGDIAAGAYKTSSWTFTGSSVGNQTLWFNITSNAYGETFNGTGKHMVRVMDSFPPMINSVSALPSPQNAGLKVNITADITDNLGVFASKAYVVGPRGFVGNFSMTKNPANNVWYADRPYLVAGIHDVTVWASDMDRWTSAQTQFTIIDSTPPIIMGQNAQPNPQQIHGNVNITAQISDQASIYEAWVEITDPLGGKTNNSLSSIINSFWYERQYDVLGSYAYRISASDPSGNWRIAVGSFNIVDTIHPAMSLVTALPNPQIVFATVNITAVIVDTGGIVGAYVEVTDPLGGRTNTSLNRNGDDYWLETAYNILGDYSFIVSAVDIVGQWSDTGGAFTIYDPWPPIAEAGLDATIPWNTTFVFDGSSSVDNFGIADYTWTFFDTTPVTLTGISPTYRFTNLGTFTVTLTVKDYANNEDNDTMRVTVRDFTKPEIRNLAAVPSPQNPNVPVNVSATITDNIAVSEVWINILDPLAVRRNVSMPNAGGSTYALVQSYLLIGTYYFDIWASDSSRNWNTISGVFEVRDMLKPAIISSSAQPDPQEVLSSVQIAATVQDNVGVSPVWAKIVLPGGALAGNYSMFFDPGSGTYRKTYPTDALGIHTFTIWAGDQAGNWNSSSGQFLVRDSTSPTISPTNANTRSEVDTVLNFTAVAQDNFRIDKVYADISTPTGGQLSNYTMKWGPGIGGNYYILFSPTEIGTYDVNLSVSDTAGNWGIASATVTSVDTGLPNADAGPDQTVFVGDLVSFDGSASTDSHGIADYTWTFTENSTLRTLHGPRPSFTFTQASTYSVTLTVTDYSGNSDTDRVNIIVNAEPNDNGGNNGDGGNPINLIANEILAYSPWSFILIFAIVILIIGGIAASRKSKRERLEGIQATKEKAMARHAAMQATAPPPPPPEGEEFPEAPVDEPAQPVTPPPPEEDEAGSPPTPPPPEDQ